MTTPLLQLDHTDEDEDVSHIWCDGCDDKPHRAICGARLRGEMILKPVIVCERCKEFCSMHQIVLHPWD